MKHKIYKLVGLVTSLFSSATLFAADKNSACDVDVIKSSLDQGGWLNIEGQKYYLKQFKANPMLAKKRHLEFLAAKVEQEICPIQDFSETTEWLSVLTSVYKVLGFDVATYTSTSTYTGHIIQTPNKYNPSEASQNLSMAMYNLINGPKCGQEFFYVWDVEKCLIQSLTDNEYESIQNQHDVSGPVLEKIRYDVRNLNYDQRIAYYVKHKMTPRQIFSITVLNILDDPKKAGTKKLFEIYGSAININ